MPVGFGPRIRNIRKGYQTPLEHWYPFVNIEIIGPIIESYFGPMVGKSVITDQMAGRGGPNGRAWPTNDAPMTPHDPVKSYLFTPRIQKR